MALSFSKQQKERWQPEKEATHAVYSLDTLTKKSCIHRRSTRVSKQLQLTYHTNSTVNVAYSCLPTRLISQNTIVNTLTNSFKTKVFAIFQK